LSIQRFNKRVLDPRHLRYDTRTWRIATVTSFLFLSVSS